MSWLWGHTLACTNSLNQLRELREILFTSKGDTLVLYCWNCKKNVADKEEGFKGQFFEFLELEDNRGSPFPFPFTTSAGKFPDCFVSIQVSKNGYCEGEFSGTASVWGKFKEFGLENMQWGMLKKRALCACSIFSFITYFLSGWATTGTFINMCQYLWIVVESLLIFLPKESKPTFPVLFNVLGSNEDTNLLSFVYAFIGTKSIFWSE